MSTAPKYRVDSLTDLLNERQELNWLIEGWLEQGTLAVLIGSEGSFKTFVAIDWAMSIATGNEWQGCRVTPGRVLFIAGEGYVGLVRRLRGWVEYYERTNVDDVLLGRSAIQLLDTGDAERVAELGKFELVVIDTLARNFGPGNENDQKDMALAIRNADRIKESTGASVLLIHHTPLEGRLEGNLRPRGSSALAGACDAIFTSQFDPDSKVISVGNSKQKDAPSAAPQFLTFDVVDLGEQDNFGNEITTVVLRQTHLRPVSRRALGKNQKRLIQALRSQANGTGEALVSIREITGSMDISREARKKLEQWFTEQSWARPSVGGHIVDLERLPNV